jgi:hypothetical protein
LGLGEILSKRGKTKHKFKYEQEEIHLKGAKGVKHVPNSLWCIGSFNPCINGPRTKVAGTDFM